MSRSEDLTVLLVAEGERLAPALRERLPMHGLTVVDCAASKVDDTAFVVAPDLVVLAGSAAEDGGIDVLTALAARPATATLPVVLISDAGDAREPSSFRHGVVAVIERTASADELARRIAEVAQELPERTGESRGALREGSIGELLELLAESLRTGILSVTGPSGVSARVVLRADRPATEVIEQIVERLRPLAGETGALQYEFHETPTGRLGALDLGSDEDAIALSHLSRDRLLLIEQNPARADLLAQGLRAYGARVAVADGLGRGLELARELTPDVVVVDGSAIDGWALEALRKIRRDPWLRWASLLLVEAGRLWRDERRPDIAMLAASIDALVRADRDLLERALREPTLGTRLEVIGPVRTLRALVETKLGLRVKILHPRVVIELDLSDGLVAGASARLPHGDAPAVEGPAALATLFAISSGRVQVERAEAPRAANVMAPLDDALAAAAHEEPAVGPSLPPPSSMPTDARLPPGPRLPREMTEVAGLVGHLEQLLGELRAHSLAPPPAAPSWPSEPAPAPLSDRPSEPVPEEATSRVDALEVANLRRRMRQSSQRMRAAPGTRVPLPHEVSASTGLPAVRPASPPRPAAGVASVAHTSPGIGLPELAGRAAPARAASAPQTSPGIGLPELRGIPAPRLAAMPAAASGRAGEPETTTAAADAAPARAAAGETPAPGIPGKARPSRKQTLVFAPAQPRPAADAPRDPAPAAPVPRTPKMSAPRPPMPRGKLPEGEVPPGPAPAKPPPVEPASDVVAQAGADAVVDVEEPAPASAPFPAPAPVPAPSPASAPSPAPARALAAAHPPVAAPAPAAPATAPARPPPSAPALAPAPPPPHVPAPSIAPPLASALAPSAPRRRSSAPLVIGVALLLAAVIIGGGFWLRGRMAPAAPTGVAASSPTVASTPAGVPPPLVHPSEVVAPAGRASFGPADDAPLEGTDTDLDVAEASLAPETRPAGRRETAALVTRLLRDATAARRRDQPDDAERAYRRVLALEPTNGRATAGLAYVHLERGELPEALLWAQRMVRLRPEYASHWVLLGDVLRRGGNVDGARRAYARGLTMQPTWTTAQRRLDEVGAPTP